LGGLVQQKNVVFNYFFIPLHIDLAIFKIARL
jgi:hypothetical protein